MDLVWIVEHVLIKEFLIEIDLSCRLSCVSRKFRDLFQDDKYWQNLLQTLNIDHILQPCIPKYFPSWKELYIYYHVLRIHYIDRYKIKFDGPAVPPKHFCLDDFLPKHLQHNIKSILALKKEGPNGTSEDGCEEALFLMKDNTYFYHYEQRADIHSSECNWTTTVSEGASTLEQLWKVVEYKFGRVNEPSDPKRRLGFFTEQDLAKFIVTQIPRDWNNIHQIVKTWRYKKYVNIYSSKKLKWKKRITELDMKELKATISNCFYVGYKNRDKVRFLDKEGNSVLETTFDALPKITNVYVHIDIPKISS